ncbi:MAG: hypothetical protein ABF904_00375, partial [Ethanoligenens sp.]
MGIFVPVGLFFQQITSLWTRLMFLCVFGTAKSFNIIAVCGRKAQKARGRSAPPVWIFFSGKPGVEYGVPGVLRAAARQ